MNDAQLIGAVHSAMYRQCKERGYAAPVDVLMDIGVLPKNQYEHGVSERSAIWKVSVPSIFVSCPSSCTRCGCMHKSNI